MIDTMAAAVEKHELIIRQLEISEQMMRHLYSAAASDTARADGDTSPVIALSAQRADEPSRTPAAAGRRRPRRRPRKGPPIQVIADLAEKQSKTIPEIAEATGLSVSTVASRLREVGIAVDRGRRRRPR